MSKKADLHGPERQIEMQAIGLILKIMRMFISGAFLSVTPDLTHQIELARKSSSAVLEGDKKQAKKDDSDDGIVALGDLYMSEGFNDVVINVSGPDGLDDEYDDDDTMADVLPDLTGVESEGDSPKSAKEEPASAVTHSEERVRQITSIVKGEVASRIIGAIKDNLHTLIVATLWDMLDTTDDSTESIIQNALSLWLSCCLSNPEALASFLASESADA